MRKIRCAVKGIDDPPVPVGASRAAGVKTVLISPSDSRGEWDSSADHVASDLYEVLDLIREGRKIGG